MMADWDDIMTPRTTRLERLSERITALEAQLADVTKEREEIREKLDEFHGHLPPGCWDDIFAALDAAKDKT